MILFLTRLVFVVYFTHRKHLIVITRGKFYNLLNCFSNSLPMLLSPPIAFINKELKIKNKILFSSELNINGNSAEKILKICEVLNADTYITGTIWASKHLIINDFKNKNIEIKFQNLIHPIYNQCHTPFLPKMSTIDLLFNEGEKAREILIKSKTL